MTLDWAARMRIARAAMNLTQLEFGRRAGGLHPSEISRFEHGVRVPSERLRRRIEEAAEYWPE